MKVKVSSRDYSKPYTELEVEELKEAFRSMPTYSGTDDEYIKAEDLPNIIHAISWERTEEQIAAYIVYWNKHYNGFIRLHKFIEGMKTLHETAECSKFIAQGYDKNGDGFISADEFEEYVRFLSVHDPKFKQIGNNYENFVNEADTDGDGLVSVVEFAEWMDKTLKN